MWKIGWSQKEMEQMRNVERKSLPLVSVYLSQVLRKRRIKGELIVGHKNCWLRCGNVEVSNRFWENKERRRYILYERDLEILKHWSKDYTGMWGLGKGTEHTI